MFPMPIEDTRLNASNLGEDTTESLTKPSTTDNLLFERSRFDKYGSLQNEVSSTVPTKLFSGRSKLCSCVKLKICNGMLPEKLHLNKDSLLRFFRLPMVGGKDPDKPQ